MSARAVATTVVGRALTLGTFVLIVCFDFVTPALAQTDCINDYHKNKLALNFTHNDIEKIVEQVATIHGLSTSGIEAIPCDGVANVQATYNDGSTAQLGDYILYDETWVNQSIGYKFADPHHLKERDRAWTLIAHELGHLFLRHFTSNVKLERIVKEGQADHFAGCATGAMGADWNNVKSFFEDFRPDEDGYYLSREHAIETAKKGFDRCRKNPPPIPASLKDLTAQLRQASIDNSQLVASLGSQLQAQLLRPDLSDADVASAVDALTEKSGLDAMKHLNDEARRSVWSALGAPSDEKWRSTAPWLERARIIRQNMAAFDRFEPFDQTARSEETKTEFSLLATKVVYVVPPDRLVSAAPFRMRIDYCSTSVCTVDMILRGFDERGNLRLDASGSFNDLPQGRFVDSTLNTSAKMYFDYNQQLVDNKPILFKLFCRANGRILDGGQVSITWSAADEVSAGYAVWLSCKDATFQASLGLAISPASSRTDEPPVKPDPGPPQL